jgi:lipopolysaccharide/colanic/teichoic acid biosynthesis glycosyltransferase
VRQPLVDEGGHAEMVPKFRTRRGTLVGDDTTSWQIGNEGRVGPVGRFLRRTRLDELPQVMRVLTAQLWVFPIRTPRPRPRTPLEELPSAAAAAAGSSAASTGDEAQVDAGQLAG